MKKEVVILIIENHGELIELHYPRNYGFPLHLHSIIEIAICVKGEMPVSCNGESRVLHSGDIMVAYPHDMHSYSRSDWWEGITIQFPPNLSTVISSIVHSGHYPSFLHNDEVLELAKKLLYHNYKQKAPFSVIYGDIHTIFGLLTRETVSKPKNSADISSFDKAVKFVALNYTENISLEDVAAEVGITAPYLSKLFSNKINGGFKNYLNILRVYKAKSLLKTTNRGIYDIMLDSGFSDQGTFNRVFKSYTGMTPRNFRTSGNIFE